MRRAVPVLVATAAGLALLLSFHTSPATPTRVAHAAPVRNPPAASAPPTPSTTSPGGSRPADGSTTTSAPAGRREVDGQTVSTRYGDVQVAVTVANDQIVDVKALQLPSDRARSARISDIAGPELRDEALQAQSANIDVISGATYTSEGYAQSLQSALDAAGFHS